MTDAAGTALGAADRGPDENRRTSAPGKGRHAASAATPAPAAQDPAAQDPAAQAPAASARSGAASGERASRGPGRITSSRWFQLALLACYIAAGIVVTWPRAKYLGSHRLPATLDQSTYVWDFWWVAHQVTHFGNPWFTTSMAAPAGSWLAFDTLMPLVGLVMTPVTLLFSPTTSYNLVTILVPGLACYFAYRVAALWLRSQLGAISAGALYGLATMLAYQDWYHLNIAVGALFPPLALEAAVRLRRRPGARPAIGLGLALGTSLLVNQESAIMAVTVAGLALLPWLCSRAWRAAGQWTLFAAGVSVLVASPQLIASVQQIANGGTPPASIFAEGNATFGVPLTSVFAPSPRVADFGLGSVGALFHYNRTLEGIPTFGVVLSLLAIAGLVVMWRRRSARWLALLWLASAVLALGASITIVNHRYIPWGADLYGSSVSGIMPYIWLVHIPGLAGFREADRFTLLGLLPAALLAGAAVEWLWRRIPAVAVVALAAAVLELGFSGTSAVGQMASAMPRVDAPLRADHSHSVVVDIPWGLHGGVNAFGPRIAPNALVLATEDGHPRAVTDESWVSNTLISETEAHPFFRYLARAEAGQFMTPAQLRAAHADAVSMNLRWAVIWAGAGYARSFLHGVGFHTVSASRYFHRVGLRTGHQYPGTVAVLKLTGSPTVMSY